MLDCSLRSRGSHFEAAALLSYSQTKSVSARSFVQDSGAPAWLSTAARDFPTLTAVLGTMSRGLTLRMCRPTASVAPSVTAVLKIAREHVDAMIAHAWEDHPDEACGVIIGPEGSDLPTRLLRMINADRSPTFFRFDPQEQFELYKAMSAAGEEIVVVYHSHTSTEAYPSRTDVDLASEPQAHYVLVSTAESGASDGAISVRSYRIVDGVVSEEEIDVTE
jgi:[CysO sulfur-carrier protein]-S-L-cysteine hydrolase